MIHYGWFFGYGRSILADVLRAEDPFALPPAEIIERVLATGATPDVGRPQAEPFRQYGTVTRVERDDLHFLIGVSRDAAEISVQEERADAYERDE